MRRSPRDIFVTIKSEGGLLPVDLLQRLAEGDQELDGLSPASYHLAPHEKLGEVINRAWNRLVGAWASFQTAAAALPATDTGTTLTRERWLLILFQELGYGRLLTSKAQEIDGKVYAISHMWQHTPIHLVSFRHGLDSRTPGVAGAARLSPHSLVQEFLNRSEQHLWGMVSNGLKLRLLRDNASLTRQAFVEFDLEAMMNGEVFPDFVLLFLLLHQSRLEADQAEHCWLEKWSQEAQRRGTRALDQLRQGVEAAIKALGQGFLEHPANAKLRDRLQTGDLTPAALYEQLLRLIYRLIFLLVAEDRDLLLPAGADPEARRRYTEFYSLSRLRRLARHQRGTQHGDLWQAFAVTCRCLAQGEPALGLAPLGGFLFAPDSLAALNDCQLSNRAFLRALRHLCFTATRRLLRPIDYRNLGTEELGSVYESLLELHPQVNVSARTFDLGSASGSERKTTGSYYTPSALIHCLLDSALEPVLAQALQQPEPEKALLRLKIVDPACGSGHFLIAAAHRLAKRLAMVRTGEMEPAPADRRRALREVVSQCLYGVDINPLAVELCKVALWLETLDPGRPLGFLDHHLQCGNSLLGATPALLARGIPDEAFQAIEGDEKTYVSKAKKRNKAERQARGQQHLAFPAEPWERLGDLAAALSQLNAEGEDTLAQVQAKEARYAQLLRSSAYLFTHLWADAWCAAFVWKKTADFPYPITEGIFRRLEKNPYDLPPWMGEEIQRLAAAHRFFHWHLAFPEVFTVSDQSCRGGSETRPDEDDPTGWRGGFDVVLGNPPWERLKLQEKEFFAARDPEIAQAPNAAARKRLIEALPQTNPSLWAEFQAAKRAAEGESHFMRNSGRYPLSAVGDINTYQIFAGLARQLLAPQGRAGIIVPSGIATDDSNKRFFADLVDRQALISLYDFENREKLFPDVDSRMKFCLLTLGGDGAAAAGADFAFFLTHPEQLREEARRFTLSAADIALLNPNTRTCPIFRSRRDAELTKAIYRRVPVLIEESKGEAGNPWGIKFVTMFHMANDSHLFRTRAELEGEGWVLAPGNPPQGGTGCQPVHGAPAGCRCHRQEGISANIFVKGEERYLPLYEAKLIHHYDHRWATYQNGATRDLTSAEKADPTTVVLPRYWVPEAEVQARLAGKWDRPWLLGWRRIARTTDERTFIANIIPFAGAGDNIFFTMSRHVDLTWNGLLANFISLPFDYITRQKLGGTNLMFYIAAQLPVLSRKIYKQNVFWLETSSILAFLTPRVLELTYTAYDLAGWAADLGYTGPPFVWDDERRFLIRGELDALYFHLYGLNREDAAYILDTFPIVRRKDEQRYGEYRTKRVILEIYDALAQAQASGQPYQTLLDPPPADPRCCHPDRSSAV